MGEIEEKISNVHPETLQGQNMASPASRVQAWKTSWEKGGQDLIVKSSRERSRKNMSGPGRDLERVVSEVYMCVC